MVLSQPVLENVSSVLNIKIPIEFQQYLISFLGYNHPGNQDKIYHNLAHSFEVSALVSVILDSCQILDKWKAISVVAGLLHDLDPERQPHTPPMVERTIQYLENNPDAQAIIDYLCEVFGFTPKQIHTLILATDYSPNPEERDNKWIKFCNECEIYFEREELDTVIFLGQILAYADKASTYILSADIVVTRVRGLAFELRTLNNSPFPTDEDIFRGTASFLKSELIKNKIFQFLPLEYSRKLVETREFFAEAEFV